MHTNRPVIFYFLLCCCFLCSCLDLHRTADPVPVAVNYTIVNKSPLFNKKNIELQLDSVDHVLYVRLIIKGFKGVALPVNARYRDTLFNTAFNFGFYYHGQLIQSEYMALHNSKWLHNSTATLSDLIIATDTNDLRLSGDINFQVPMYAFHTLKKGKQSIELAISQSVFTDEANVTKANGKEEVLHIYDTASLLNERVKFDLDIPAIYKSRIYGYGLILKNDSTFSPAGMDNTLWKSSYPDIYWMIYYPTEHYYAKTLYENSTDRYTAYDTFNLYHYYPEDSIGIGVYDHDDLSRDDGLGLWQGPLSRLEKRKVNRIGFGNVKSFDVKVEKKGIVN